MPTDITPIGDLLEAALRDLALRTPPTRPHPVLAQPAVARTTALAIKRLLPASAEPAPAHSS